jgi:hypothetical protein
MRRIVVHIDQLVLRGISHADRLAVAAAIEQELRDRLAAPGVGERLTQLGALERLRLDTIHIDSGATPARIGTAAAGGIARAFTPDARRGPR